VDQADRNLTVVFGPSRSRFFPKAVAHARAVATEISEPEPGRYRASFTLGADPGPYAHASALIERVRHWRGSPWESLMVIHPCPGYEGSPCVSFTA
jgi:hypothetical protein